MTDLKQDPSAQAFQQAMACYKSGQLPVAEELCRKALSSDPRNVYLLHLLAVIAGQSGRLGETVELLSQAVRLKKDNAPFFYDLGVALKKLGRTDEALLKYEKAVTLKADYIEAHINIAAILEEQGRVDEAELKYRRIIVLKPDHAVMHHALARVLCEQDKVEEAVLVYQKAIALNPDLVEAYCNLGVIFSSQKRNDEAAAMYGEAIARQPDYVVARFNLANLFKEQGFIDEAIAQYAEAIARKPDFVEPYINLGGLLKKKNMIAEAILVYEQVLALRPDSPEQLAELLHVIYYACAWDKLGEYEARLLESVRARRKGISPFAILGLPFTAEDQLTCARSFLGGRVQPDRFTHAPKKSNDRIKIGYLSADFHNHATAHLMAELFERHNRSLFTVIAYSYGPDESSEMRKRLVKAFDNFVDLYGASDHSIAQKIYDDGVDILIDLKGYTTDARLGIPAYRPAPIQVNYLGYPGTMGVDFIDYIIADKFLIPEDQQQFYSEKVAYLPDCYQPNDTHRKIAEAVPTREACGLPAQGFVFCCFNANYKITPQFFDVWMRLLKRVPDSVLWLFQANPSVTENLRQEALRRGVDPARIIFAPKMPLPEHLARHQLADLFLDTLPINAHTTTSDALWAGLPVLTCVGSTFVGRVAGSLLTAAGLPELITYSPEEYEALALQLAQNPAQLAAIRRKLTETRLQMSLFDIEKFVKNIEKSYQMMWDIWQAGNAPKSFAVSGD